MFSLFPIDLGRACVARLIFIGATQERGMKIGVAMFVAGTSIDVAPLTRKVLAG